SLERYIILNAIDRLWQGKLYALDAFRGRGRFRGRTAQKDPLIEYKIEAYEMFTELMANIKNEVLHNLFRSTSNLQAFEKFLSSLPQFLLKEQAPAPQAPTAPQRILKQQPAMAGMGGGGNGDGADEVTIDLPVKRSLPK